MRIQWTKWTKGFLTCGFLLGSLGAWAKDLRVFTWDGYVTAADVKAIDALLEAAGNAYRVKVIEPFAQGPEQMFDVMRQDKCDLSFLTLNYIKMDKAKIQNLLQPIDTSKLSNFKFVRSELQGIPLGLDEEKNPLYIPFGGGAYGLWANMKKYKPSDLPKKLSDLLNPKWHGKIMLTDGQVQPNVAMSFLSVNKNAPFVLHEKLEAEKRDEAMTLADANGPAQKFLNDLYKQVDTFWADAPSLKNPVTDEYLVASYGIEVAAWNQAGGDWQLIKFEEGNTVWLDTVNILKSVTEPEKLSAAYIFMDYFLSTAVQERVVNGLSMVSSVKNVARNPLIDSNKNFFDKKLFWPAYSAPVTNMMKDMHLKALSNRR